MHACMRTCVRVCCVYAVEQGLPALSDMISSATLPDTDCLKGILTQYRLKFTPHN